MPPLRTREKEATIGERWRGKHVGLANTMLLDTTDRIFAANRAIGRVSLNAKWAEGATRRGRVHEQGPLRVRCPGSPASELEAMLVNTAGGMAGGGRGELDFSGGSGA